jgi:antitoxin MazE
MKLTKTPDGYIVQVPDDVVKALGLHDGDRVRVSRPNVIELTVSQEERDNAIEEMKRLARPLPADYRFDREEANAR